MLSLLRRLVDPRARLLELLGDAQVPTFPAVARRILQQLREDATSLRDIGNELAEDPGLSVQVLRTANSAAFGLRRPASHPAHAAVLVGRSGLESLVLGVSVHKLLPGPPIEGFDSGRFWAMAARRAATGRVLADTLSPVDRELCFTAGLLQDLAVPLLADANPKDYRALLAEVGAGRDLAARERAAYGWDHAQVAGWLCSSWDFPGPLRDAIVGHHSGQAPVPVCIAALLDDPDDVDDIVARAEQQFGVDAGTVTEALQRGRATAHELADLFT